MALVIVPFAAQTPNTAPTVAGPTATATTGYQVAYRIVDFFARGNRTEPSPVAAGHWAGNLTISVPAYLDNELGAVGYEILAKSGNNWFSLGEPSQSGENIVVSTASLSRTEPTANYSPGTPITKMRGVGESQLKQAVLYGYATDETAGVFVTVPQKYWDMSGKLAVGLVGTLSSAGGGGAVNTNQAGGITWVTPLQSANYIPLGLDRGDVAKFSIAYDSPADYHNSDGFELDILSAGIDQPAPGFVPIPSPSAIDFAQVSPNLLYSNLFETTGGRVWVRRDTHLNIFERILSLPKGTNIDAQGYTFGAAGYNLVVTGRGEMLVKLPGEPVNADQEIVVANDTGYRFCFYSGTLVAAQASGPINVGKAVWYTSTGQVTETPDTVFAGVALNSAVLGEQVTILQRGTCTTKETLNVGGVTIICSAGTAGWNFARVS